MNTKSNNKNDCCNTKCNNISTVIQYKLKNSIYNSISEKAAEQNLSPNLYARQLLISSLNGGTGLTPEMLCLLSGLYEMLKVPQKQWNHEMHNNFKKGMKQLYDNIQGNE